MLSHSLGRGEEQIRDMIRDPPVDLFGHHPVKTHEARLHMPDPDVKLRRRKCTGKSVSAPDPDPTGTGGCAVSLPQVHRQAPCSCRPAQARCRAFPFRAHARYPSGSSWVWEVGSCSRMLVESGTGISRWLDRFIETLKKIPVHPPRTWSGSSPYPAHVRRFGTCSFSPQYGEAQKPDVRRKATEVHGTNDYV